MSFKKCLPVENGITKFMGYESVKSFILVALQNILL